MNNLCSSIISVLIDKAAISSKKIKRTSKIITIIFQLSIYTSSWNRLLCTITINTIIRKISQRDYVNVLWYYSREMRELLFLLKQFMQKYIVCISVDEIKANCIHIKPRIHFQRTKTVGKRKWNLLWCSIWIKMFSVKKKTNKEKSNLIHFTWAPWS